MRTVTIEKDIYTFDELSEQSKQKAIDDYIGYLLTIDCDYCNENIEEDLKMNEYYLDGSLYLED